MAGLHALLAPSAAPRWMRCIGSVAAIKAAGLDGGTTSEYAAEGSVAHDVAHDCLTNDTDAIKYIGETRESDGFEFVVDDDMASFVQVYVDAIRARPGERMIEECLDLLHVYGVDNQFGTGDAIIFHTDEDMIEVHDLKFGRGVMVFAKDNEQLYSYGGGAYKLFEPVWDWKKIKVCIHQPRLDHYDEYILTREEMETFIERATVAARQAVALIGEEEEVIADFLTAGTEQCQWCPLKGSCNTLAQFVHDEVYLDFPDLTERDEMPTKDIIKMSPEQLAGSLERLDIILAWASEVRAEGLKRVVAGIEVPRWKQVAGKKGSRKWGDEEEAKKIMMAARLKSNEMYNRTLITAPAAEKVLKKLKKPKIWNKLAALIVQKDGAPGLAPESDPRDALITTDAFKDVTDMADFADLI